MSRFFDGGDDDYGTRRDTDFKFAGGVSSGPQASIEKMLLQQGVSGADANETANAIVKLTEKQKDAPLEKQRQTVQLFVEPLLRGKDKGIVDQVVASATRMAVAEAREKNAFSIQPLENDKGATARPPAPPKAGR